MNGQNHCTNRETHREASIILSSMILSPSQLKEDSFAFGAWFLSGAWGLELGASATYECRN
jgi:hypothetical protein